MFIVLLIQLVGQSKIMKRSIINIFVAPEGCINVDTQRSLFLFEFITIPSYVRRAISSSKAGNSDIFTFARPFDIETN